MLLAACVYDVPITTQHEIAVDQSILGAWEHVPEGDDSSTKMRIFQFSDTEYLVHYLEGDLELHFRAYAFAIDGVKGVQLEAIGDSDQAVGKDLENRYTVASYRMVDGKLEVRTLNTELVDADIADSESLRAEFLKHRDHPELFNDPGLFQRVVD